MGQRERSISTALHFCVLLLRGFYLCMTSRNTYDPLVPTKVRIYSPNLHIDSLFFPQLPILYLSEEELLLRLPLPVLLQRLLLQLLWVGGLLLDGDPRQQGAAILVLPQLLLRLLWVALMLTAHRRLAGLGHHLQDMRGREGGEWWWYNVKFISQSNSRMWQIPSNVWGCIQRRQQTNGHALCWIKFLANHSFLWSILLLTSLIWITQSDWCLAHFKPIRSNWMWVATLLTVLQGQNDSCQTETFHTPRCAAFHRLILGPAVNRVVIQSSIHSLLLTWTIQSAIQGCGVLASVVCVYDVKTNSKKDKTQSLKRVLQLQVCVSVCAWEGRGCTCVCVSQSCKPLGPLALCQGTALTSRAFTNSHSPPPPPPSTVLVFASKQTSLSSTFFTSSLSPAALLCSTFPEASTQNWCSSFPYWSQMHVSIWLES